MLQYFQYRFPSNHSYDSTKEETAFGGFENYGSYLSETEQQIIPSAKNMLETAPDYALPESIAFDDGFKETQEYVSARPPKSKGLSRVAHLSF
jgi:hypothetical protein